MVWTKFPHFPTKKVELGLFCVTLILPATEGLSQKSQKREEKRKEGEGEKNGILEFGREFLLRLQLAKGC